MRKREPPKKSSKEYDFLIKSPETTADFVAEALNQGGLDEVVRLLRDWCGSKPIRGSLKKLHHRDPVNRFLYIRRHAVEIYAKRHGLTPANLMVEIVGEQGRKDPKGAERHKLRGARKFLENDEEALNFAKALADHWGKEGAGRKNHGAFLRDFTRKFTFG